ncbi:serpin family protein [uncultured Duncaniella sp.]|uniref:serpin family protein n=2 Tax=uncultured Duncaniella sp. TaxID=2768039 RepID=UPI00261A85DE|nr:serpin family protein [uncultured Duncaniella sp.]
MKKLTTFAIGMTLALASCSNDNDVSDNSRHEINLPPAQSEIVTSQISMAFDMLRYFHAKSGNDNFMVSPLSAQFALGMLMNGADGNTLAQLTDALGVTSVSELNSLNKLLMSELPKADRKTTFQSANSIWLREEFNVLPSFSLAMTDIYNAEATSLDLTSFEAVERINRWCSDQTKGMIKETLKEPCSDDTVFLLINALYFKGEWEDSFKKSDTTDKEFRNSDGTKSMVSTMCDSNHLISYGNYPDYSVASLAYGNGTYTMTIILPEENRSLESVIEDFDLQSWNDCKNRLSKFECSVELPKFKIESDLAVDDFLKSLGVKDAFNPRKANFSKLSDYQTFVSKAKQLTSIDVDEKGTEASAVTIIQGELTAVGPGPQLSFHVNRPFAFMIEESSTGAILFAGCVNRL